MKAFQFSVIILSVFIAFACPLTAQAKIETFTKVVSQPFGGSQSPDDARFAAIAKAKREILEEAGTYMESLTVVRNFAVEKDEILALAAGVLKTEIVSQKNYTTGDAFGITIVAKVVVDTNILEERIKKLLQDRTLLEKYRKIQQREKELLTKIAKLQKRDRNISSLPSEQKEELKKQLIVATKELRYLNKIVDNFDLGEITENESKYKVHGLEIFGVRYFLVNTYLGNAFFRKDKSVIQTTYNIIKGKVVGTTSIQSGEEGLYFIDPKKKYWNLNRITISSNTYKVMMKEPTKIKKKGGIGVFMTTEKHSELNMPYIKLPMGLCYILKYETPFISKSPNDVPTVVAGYTLNGQYEQDEQDKSREKYDFYVIPVDKSQIRINQNGEITVINEDQILRPTVRSWPEIAKKISEIEPSQREIVEKAFRSIGMECPVPEGSVWAVGH